MSKLKKFLGKPQMVKLGNEEIELMPLNVGDMDTILGLESKDERVKNSSMKELIRRTLKRSVPDAEDEEINGMSLEYFQDLMQAIIKVNGFEETKIQEMVNKKKEESQLSVKESSAN